MSDLDKALAANSDQLNAIDLGGGPRTITITKAVVDLSKDQKIIINYDGDEGKPWKPSKGMGRILRELWKCTHEQWAGNQVTLFREPTVPWGGKEVGGIQISNISGLSKPTKVSVRKNRTQVVTMTIYPIEGGEPAPKPKDHSVAIANARVAAKNGKGAFTAWWNSDEGKGSRESIDDATIDELKADIAKADADDNMAL